MNMHAVNRIATLLARRLGKSASEEELKELAILLSEHPEYSFLAETVNAIKGERLHVEKNTGQEEFISEGWEHLAGKLGSVVSPTSGEGKGIVIPTSVFNRKVIRWAAVITGVAMALGGSLIYHFHTPLKQLVKRHEMTVPYGKQLKIVMPDGTLVRLNAGSRFAYTSKYGEENREVVLDGEAYFEVKKEMDHPFIVKAGNITVRVLGTSFNVKAYSHDGNIETTLLEGKIAVQMNDDPEKKIILSPYEKLTVMNISTPVLSLPSKPAVPVYQGNELKYKVQELACSKETNFVAETAWVQNRLVFVNEPFAAVAQKMERWYNVRIHFLNEQLEKEKLSGVFENESIQQALKILQLTTGFKYTVKEPDIYLSR